MTDTDDVYVQATFTSSEGPTVTMREVVLGLSPSILIEPDVDVDAGRYGFVLSAVDLDPTDLVTILRLCADNIEIAAEREGV
jgi:hypothetical protein